MIHERIGVLCYDWDFFRDEGLDVSEVLLLLCIDERKRCPSRTRTTSTSDTVDIGLSDVRHLVVDDVLELIDIDTARCDICRDEDTCRLSLEVRECSLTSSLTLVPVDCLSDDTMLCEHTDDLISTVLGPSEDECSSYILILQDMAEEMILIQLVDIVDLLFDDIGSR